MSEQAFDEQRVAGGYGDEYQVDFFARGNPEMHTHEFDALLLITSGEVTIRYDGHEQLLGPGDLCSVSAGTRHAELCSQTGTIARVVTRTP